MKLSLLGTAGISRNACCLAIIAASVISLCVIDGPAAADPYKWCAQYRNGSNNGGFTTIEQGRASVSGIGGSCVPNQFYTGPEKRLPSVHRSKLSANLLQNVVSRNIGPKSVELQKRLL